MQTYIAILILSTVLFFAVLPNLVNYDVLEFWERFKISVATVYFLAFAIVVIESVFNLVDIFIGW